MEDGGWRMEDGGWRMEEGRWKMEDGRWKMEDGRWKMEDGRWTMDDGRWTMDDGRWKMPTGGIPWMSHDACLSTAHFSDHSFLNFTHHAHFEISSCQVFSNLKNFPARLPF
jgi:hypothetical protein